MSIVDLPDVMKFCKAQDSEKDAVELIQLSIEEWIQSDYCRNRFESASYKEILDGGVDMLQLKNYPITAITRLAVGVNTALYVKNTESSTNATVSVTSTAVVLVKDGTTTSVAFTDYATIQKVVDYINTLGSGWVATVVNAYAGFLSTELIEKFGSYCLNSTQVGLYIPDSSETNYEVYPARGQIILTDGFPAGCNNVFVDYTAGYASASMPSRLKLAVQILVKHVYQRKSEETFGLENYSLGDIKAIFSKGIPKEAAMILDGFAKILV